jgi:Mg2+ and Co2+ transporter CorA
VTIRLQHEGRRVYLLGDTFADKDRIFAAKDRIQGLGGKWDPDRRAWWVGAAKAGEAEALAAALTAAPPAAEDLSRCRVYARVRYKGRQYYVIAETADRCRLTILDGSVNFWADKAACELVREYAPREYRGRTEYQTLGGIRRFAEKQQRARRAGEPACAACGRAGELIEDLEDGAMKCRGCCDIPSA